MVPETFPNKRGVARRPAECRDWPDRRDLFEKASYRMIGGKRLKSGKSIHTLTASPAQAFSPKPSTNRRR